MIKLVMISLMLMGSSAMAQKEDLNARDPRLNEGSLFTLTLTPKAKKLVVSLAGKPEVELGPDSVILFGREILGSGKTRNLTIRPSETGFEIVEQVAAKRKIEIDVQDSKDKTKKETFKIELP